MYLLYFIHVFSQRQVPYSFLFKPFPWICSNYNVYNSRGVDAVCFNLVRYEL